LKNSLRLGTRGSALALAQADLVRGLLLRAHPDLAVETVVIKTTGDKMADSPLAALGGKGIFIKEIEEALLDGRIDLAVHSMKDLPTDMPERLAVGAVLEREDPRDCVISRFGEQLRELPRGAVVGTSSLRRQAQIRAADTRYPVRVRDMRGNLDTRIRKVMEGEVDSVVVAHAGVRRLGRAGEVSEVLPYDVMLPAPAQGCIALELRRDDGDARARAAALDHGPSARAATAERSFLAGLGGGCRVPIAAHAAEEGGVLRLDGLVISADGARRVRGQVSGPAADAERLGRDLTERLRAEGAGDILRALDPSGRG
jgi:hydroxymethylbilane synthase